MAAEVLRDFARLPGLAFAVARCADHAPAEVLRFAWMYCDDALALAQAAAAASGGALEIHGGYDHGPGFDRWWFVHERGGSGYDLCVPREHANWWSIQLSGTTRRHTVEQWRRMLRRRVSLRAMLAHLGLAGGRRAA